MILGCAAGIDCPIEAISLCDAKIINDLKACTNQTKYILKAIEENCIHNPCTSKYVLIVDTKITPGNYNIVTFELPKEILNNTKTMSVKITQISDAFKIYRERPEINSKLYIGTTQNELEKLYKHQRYWGNRKNIGEIKLSKISIQPEKGIIIEVGEMDFSKQEIPKTATIVTTYNKFGRKSMLPKGVKSRSIRYAILIELSNLPKTNLIK
ncbi:MAG: hypothetical protein PHV37_08965 [Candidatus Gastranaerophilales bacterium]|nr:hypothetical protein [Candidatus Gastranaerophilales bacterium]